jgi:uncharacterized protein (DUF2236 family)
VDTDARSPDRSDRRRVRSAGENGVVSIPDSLLDPVRRQVGHAVRTRVAGDDPRAASEQIWGVPGPRWFTPADPIWIVHGDASMFVAGIRALLLQSLHPLAMAGVAGHSGFRGDPWGRLQRTSRFIATTTYGAIPEAERLIARIRGIHRRVVGTAEDGRPYAASDPRLLRWVHVAEADSFLTAYQRLSPTPLDDASADTYVAQIGSIAERLGVADPPRTVKGLAATIDSYREELEATPAALDAAQFLLHDPPWARAMLHLAGPDILHRSVGIRVGRAAAGLIRWGLTHPEVLAQRQVATR